ncbi:ABC-F family ATP-binding cassette domain-containing protein [Chitinophaga sp. Cy-1792]|uniref:ABC-F family ATP-binding cassette domain-containing protein n=1 Tax=Chitinophaga sp. Cy-1792 TaxID=2608339 RepID=UPI001420046E|nr:ABC-F family ATP-binding cassette domain-containing protein [Chitinophaga sp. Cy-1792]
MLINIQNISYQTPAHKLLFENVGFTVKKYDKTAIVGNNGTGKSTLLKIIAGREKDYSGQVLINATLYYVPQHYGHFNHTTVAEALSLAPILQALHAVGEGSTIPEHYDLLENNWDIEARYQEAFNKWGIPGVTPDQPLSQLSGGMKTKLFLSGIDIFQPEIVLLDEPTNHLDHQTRQLLLQWLEETTCTVLLVSHDRQLLRHCNPILELTPGGINTYGGNYDFYELQKENEIAAQEHKLDFHEKALKEAKKKQQEAHERKQRADAQARKNAANSSDPKILLNGRKMAAEVSGGKLKHIHDEKVSEIRSALQDAAAMAHIQQMMKGYFASSAFPSGKVLWQANDINFSYNGINNVWPSPLTFTIRSGNRLAITGPNGSGKSTLMQLLSGALRPTSGTMENGKFTTLMLDQDYSIIDRDKTVLEQALAFNERKLEEAMVHTTLANFLFKPDSWKKPCSVLSGGEMLRLALCCMILQNKAPDIIFLDEPVNNLDLANIQMLGKIFAGYKGTLLVISHDTEFLKDAEVTTELRVA